MVSPFDYVNPGSPPSPMSYGAGNMAQQLYQMIGGLPQAYFTGTQNARTIALQNQFKNGLPTGPDGQPDIPAIAGQLIKTGGADWGKELLPFLWKQQFLNADQGQDGAPAASPQRPTLAPDHITPAALRSAAQGQPQGGQPSAPGDNAADTVRSIATELGGPNRDLASRIPNYARAIGVDPDAPLSLAQADRARAIIRSNVIPTGGPAGALSTAEDNDTTPRGAGANPRGQPSSGAGIPAVTPPQQAGGVPGATAIVPPGADPRAFAYALKTAAKGERDRARAEGIAGFPTKAREDKAAAYDKQADMVLEQLAKAGELTPEQKNVASGATEKGAQIKEDTTRYGKQLASIQGSASAANRQLEHIQFAEALYNDPKLYTGAGESLNLMYKKVANALNPNNTDALPQEAFRKTMAASVLNQVEQLKDDTAAAGGGGRLFQAQIELMEKAANNPDNTLAANRLLTEINKRASLTAKKIASMANSYKGGHLDAGFAQMVDDYYSTHPMFTPEEMQDVRRIAPPVVKDPSDLKKIGWKDGMPFKTPDGRVMTHIRVPGE